MLYEVTEVVCTQLTQGQLHEEVIHFESGEAKVDLVFQVIVNGASLKYILN